MELKPGTFVTPNVCLVELLGEGGMGAVWVADHVSLKTRVAVKFVSADLVKADPAIIERFKREAALCAQIKSPNVVQTFDHGIMDDGRPYIVMELLEGESLRARLDRVARLSLAETKEVISQTCKALSKAHRLGIVHRDIKPDNLFLTHDEDELFLLKVLDFGIAKQTNVAKAESMTSTGAMVGTPEYMSPEQVLSSRTVDFKSDLWAVGVVAYHCLSGTVPFRGETLGSLCVAIANAKFIAPSQHRGELPAAVDRWFDAALATDPLLRHASAKDMSQSFARAIDPNAVIDDPSTIAEASTPGEAHVAIDEASPFAATAISGIKPAPTFTGAAVSSAQTRPRRGLRWLAAAGMAVMVVGGGALVLVSLKPSPAPPPAQSSSLDPQPLRSPAQGGAPTPPLQAGTARPPDPAPSAATAEANIPGAGSAPRPFAPLPLTKPAPPQRATGAASVAKPESIAKPPPRGPTESNATTKRKPRGF